jgi:hypothetical protein
VEEQGSGICGVPVSPRYLTSRAVEKATAYPVY